MRTDDTESITLGDKPMINALADVRSTNIGKRTRIWQFCIVMEKAIIGDDCNINALCLIEGGARVGSRVTIKSGVQIWDGVTLEDDVFVGPNTTFTNDPFPRSKIYPDKCSPTLVENGASIGANATILCGVTIGARALVGAGSVVTKDIPSGEVWVGNPARFLRKI